MTARATRVKSPLPAQRRRRQSIAPRHRKAFLEALSAGWAVRHAATLSRVDFRRWYELRDADEGFANEWTEALAQGVETLEDEARRRAVDGYEELTYDGDGVLIRRVRRYSDALLQTLLKGWAPEKYRDNASRVELTGPGGSPVQVESRGYTLGALVAWAADNLDADAQLTLPPGRLELEPTPGKDDDA